MLKSMTAFGRARGMSPDGSLDITAEIKSVNSRFLDCSVKISHLYSHLESRVRTALSAAGIARGKVDVWIGVDVLKHKGLSVSLDTEAAASYIAALQKLRDTFGLRDDISVMSVARNQDLFTVQKPEEDIDSDWEEIRPVLEQAICDFDAMRRREGENLCRDLLSKADGMKASAARIKELSEADIAGYPAKLEGRIRQFLKDFDVETSEQRILTEAAVFADKAAIDEELVRLDSHFSALDGMLNAAEPTGRKLDFLVQEINREINTIGSKAANVEIARLVVDMKTELEKIREQIQNLE